MVSFVGKWFDRFSNWQFVVVYATCCFVAVAVAGYVVSRFIQLNLRVYVVVGVAVTVANTVSTAWRRWK